MVATRQGRNWVPTRRRWTMGVQPTKPTKGADMNEEITLEKLHGRIEALQAIQSALLTAVASQAGVNLPNIARNARSLAMESQLTGEARKALEDQIAALYSRVNLSRELAAS